MEKIKSLVLFSLIGLFPLFFLPITQEYFLLNKLYLLAFGVVLLVIISTVEMLVTKKIVWSRKPFDAGVLLFTISAAVSVVVSSPNKIQALLTTQFGLVSLLALGLIYFYISRNNNSDRSILNISVLNISALIVALVTIFFFFEPFKKINFPFYLQFLKNPGFSPLGIQLDVVLFLGFFIVYELTQMLTTNHSQRKNSAYYALNALYFVPLLVATVLTIYSIVKQSGSQLALYLPPLRLSWYSAVETLKNPVSALFGVGVDNFSAIFTRVKDPIYNASGLWQISSFSVGRSAVLQILTEMGILGLITFMLLVFGVIKHFTSKKHFHLPSFTSATYLLIMFFIFPVSLPLLFLFFVILGMMGSDEEGKHGQIDLENLMPLYAGLPIIVFLLVGASVFFLGRTYVSEYYFKRSLDAVVSNSAKQLYDNQRQAIILNPYIERYRVNFSQTNLLIANNIASRAGSTPGTQLTENDRTVIAQAIQAAISEGKAAVTLNPQKAGNWENLALIYRNVLNVAQGADAWTISSYQRAIIIDPQNPVYRLNLGGIYYSLNAFDDAIKMFEQTVALKPDWANAHYNLAWAHYQRGNYQQAAAEMQNVIGLVDPKSAKADYDKATSDFNEFKKKLPTPTPEAGSQATPTPSQLRLPSPPVATVEPKIKLPQEASPEAR